MTVFLKICTALFLLCLMPSNTFANAGSCCLNGGVCYDTMNIETCQVFGGVWYPGITCDKVECETNCGGQCSPGETLDCFGNCFPVSWIGDGYCDDGSYQWDTHNIFLNCEEFGYDGGDCGSHPNPPLNPGACCIGSLDSCDERICDNLLYADCLNVGGQFLGEHTICHETQCSCPPGLIADCEGKCFPIYYLNDGTCHQGQGWPFDDLSLNCFELACDLGDCSGICSGACCIEEECYESVMPLTCAESGGTFLGGQNCVNVECTNFLIPIHLTTEFEGVGAYIYSGHNSSIVDTKDNISVLSLTNCISIDGNPVSVVDIYEGDEFLNSIIHPSDGATPVVATDGVRVVMAIGNSVYAYVKTKFGFVLEDSFTSILNSDIESIDISNDKIAISYGGELMGGEYHAHMYELKGSQWSYSASVQVNNAIQALALDGDTLAVWDSYRLSMHTFSGTVWNTEYNEPHVGIYGDVDVDGTRVIIGETSDYVFGYPSIGQARILRRVNGVWIEEAMLVPADTKPNDIYGMAVSISGDIACVSAIHDDGMANNGGVVAIFRFIDGAWKHAGKVYASDVLDHMRFGVDVAIDENNIVVGWARKHDLLFGQTFYGAQISSFDMIDWINYDGGDVTDEDSWSPLLPTSSDVAHFGVSSKYTVSFNGEVPFGDLKIGPSRPSFDLNNQDITLSSIHIAGSQSYTANLAINSGNATVTNDIVIGATQRPGGLTIGSGSSVVVQGNYSQLDNGVLEVVLGSSSTPALLVAGETFIGGTLKLTLMDLQDNPDIGENWTILKTASPPTQDSERYRVAMLPGIGKDKYFNLEYVQVDGGIELQATVNAIDDLFDLEDSQTVNVAGRATDLVVADFGSLSGPPDGYDDIGLTIGGSPGFVYLFINDGQGGFSTQIAYNAGNGPSSLNSGDLDGDGTLDLIVSNQLDDTIFALINDGGSPSSMTVTSMHVTGDAPVDTLIMNIDDDEENEVVVSCEGDGELLPDGTVSGELIFYEVNPGLRVLFTTASVIPLEKPGKIDPGDVNNDKDLPEIVVSIKGVSSVGSLKRQGGALPIGFDWEVVQVVPVGADPSYIRMGDLDGDGDLDAVVSNSGTNTLSVLVKNQLGEFNPEIIIEAGQSPGSLDLFDYDGDSDLDLVVIAGTDSDDRGTYVYRNDTSLNPENQITFALEQILDEGSMPLLVGSGSIDNDEIEDLVSIVSGSGFRGNGNGDLDSILQIRSIPETATCAADLDFDGIVGVEDLLIVISAWGTPDGDLNDDRTTDVEDLLVVISLWGDCP